MLLPLLLGASSTGPPTLVIRVNQLGYLPNAPKIAVACVADRRRGRFRHRCHFTVQDTTGTVVQSARSAKRRRSIRPVREHLPTGLLVGTRRRAAIASSAVTSARPIVRVDARAYAGAADTLLYYMRQQRSGYNPTLRDSVHKRDGIIVDHPTRTGEFINVSGGWADAADYLQYVTTSATATYVMLKARRDFPRAFADRFDANGLAGRVTGSTTRSTKRDTGSSGSCACSRTTRRCSTSSPTIGITRTSTCRRRDSADYGWGKGKERPVYPCTGKPQGLFTGKNRSNGYASTAGKYAATFALAVAGLCSDRRRPSPRVSASARSPRTR